MTTINFTWRDEMILSVTEVCKEGVESWITLIENLGVPETIRREWCVTYLQEVKNVMTEMQKDLEERQKNMQRTIVELKHRVSEVTYELGLTASYTLEPNLYLEETKLKSYLADLEQQLTRKEEEIQSLLNRQDIICNTLGKPKKILNQKPLPSAQDLEDFLIYIESLEDESFLREEKFTSIQCELQKLAAEIQYDPACDFEAQILTGSETPFEVNDKNMIKLNAFQQNLQQHAGNIKTEVEIFMDQIQQLWSTLDTDKKYCAAFINEHSGFDQKTIAEIKAEIKRLEDLKKANIGMLIQRLQSQLVVQWDKCHFTDEQRRAFNTFDDNIYTESMLTLYQNELRKISKRYEDNKVLYESLQKYGDTWKRVDELETPIQGQNRFRNRGGKLLIEEKERKLARKRLEKLEANILKLVDDYFKDNQEDFLYEGELVEEYLKALQKEERQEHKIGKVSSKSTLSSAKSSNLMDSCRPLQASNNSHHSPKRRPPPQGDSRLEYTASTHRGPKSAAMSGVANSAPSRVNNPILSRKGKIKKTAPICNLKHKTMLMPNDEELTSVVRGYSYFQKIIDTTMPTLVNNTMDGIDCEANINKRSTNIFDDESPLAVPLDATPSTSQIEDNSTDSVAGTPKTQFHNITMRRMFRSTTKDKDESNMQ